MSNRNSGKEFRRNRRRYPQLPAYVEPLDENLQKRERRFSQQQPTYDRDDRRQSNQSNRRGGRDNSQARNAYTRRDREERSAKPPTAAGPKLAPNQSSLQDIPRDVLACSSLDVSFLSAPLKVKLSRYPNIVEVISKDRKFQIDDWGPSVTLKSLSLTIENVLEMAQREEFDNYPNVTKLDASIVKNYRPAAILPLMSIIPKLKYLNLSCVTLDATHMKTLTAMGAEDLQLSTLILEKCGLTDESLRLLCAFIERNPCFRYVDLSDNRGARESIEHLCRAVEAQGQLVELGLEYMGLGPDASERIATMAESPSGPAVLRLTGNPFMSNADIVSRIQTALDEKCIGARGEEFEAMIPFVFQPTFLRSVKTFAMCWLRRRPASCVAEKITATISVQASAEKTAGDNYKSCITSLLRFMPYSPETFISFGSCRMSRRLAKHLLIANAHICASAPVTGHGR